MVNCDVLLTHPHIWGNWAFYGITWHYMFLQLIGEGSASPFSKPQTQPESQQKPQPTARPKSFSFSQAAASEAKQPWDVGMCAIDL